jgi:hypothetical protein
MGNAVTKPKHYLLVRADVITKSNNRKSPRGGGGGVLQGGERACMARTLGSSLIQRAHAHAPSKNTSWHYKSNDDDDGNKYGS